LIESKNNITIDEMVAKIGKSRRTLTRHIKQMQEKGILSRIGSDKTGHWQINKTLDNK
jgi:predicted HTH transcriptional regulator